MAHRGRRSLRGSAPRQHGVMGCGLMVGGRGGGDGQVRPRTPGDQVRNGSDILQLRIEKGSEDLVIYKESCSPVLLFMQLQFAIKSPMYWISFVYPVVGMQ